MATPRSFGALITGVFQDDDGWRSPPLEEARYPRCPDCGKPLLEEASSETLTGPCKASSEAGIAVVACVCGSAFAVVTVAEATGVFNRLRRLRLRR